MHPKGSADTEHVGQSICQAAVEARINNYPCLLPDERLAVRHVYAKMFLQLFPERALCVTWHGVHWSSILVHVWLCCHACSCECMQLK
jgi:hypothetical protein